MTTLSIEFYVIVEGAQGRYGMSLHGPRIAKPRNGKPPATKAGEIAIHVTLNLPDQLFKRPQFTATIAVDEDRVSGPVIDADVTNNIEKLVQEHLGINLTIEQANQGETR